MNIQAQFNSFGPSSQVRAVVSLIDVISILVVICKAAPDEVFATVGNHGFRWELHLSSIENGLISHYSHLRLVVAEGFHAEQKLIEDYANAPNVNLNTK